ncbi:MarR family transcriptional regulator [Methanoregula sp.]|uniref:helix-turn-helix transcriptional regulator n=1 Tax=Methanoregula sp. TaxID=2052170 RepID=UPI002632267A|nr:MarR family transcriptional regulator [Methanoregula sp.]MDD5142185.1 MarR family transcriptional regulator [Methanoregula sp.]
MHLNKKAAFAMGISTASAFLLALTFLRPLTINVVFNGGDPAVASIPGVYTLLDCVIIAVTAFLLGISMMVLYRIYSHSADDATIVSLQKGEPVPEILQSPDHSTLHQIAGPGPETVPEESPGIVLNLLKGNERSVMEALMNHGEMNQADLSARTGIPKSTLSRTLQNLENRRLIFRYDNGMSKMVKPEIHWKGTGSNNHH